MILTGHRVTPDAAHEARPSDRARPGAERGAAQPEPPCEARAAPVRVSRAARSAAQPMDGSAVGRLRHRELQGLRRHRATLGGGDQRLRVGLDELDLGVGGQLVEHR